MCIPSHAASDLWRQAIFQTALSLTASYKFFVVWLSSQGLYEKNVPLLSFRCPDREDKGVDGDNTDVGALSWWHDVTVV